MPVGLFQPKNSRLQFEFIAARDGDRSGGDQCCAVGVREQDSGQTTMAELAGIAENQPMFYKALSQPQGQWPGREMNDAFDLLFSSLGHGGKNNLKRLPQKGESPVQGEVRGFLDGLGSWGRGRPSRLMSDQRMCPR